MGELSISKVIRNRRIFKQKRRQMTTKEVIKIISEYAETKEADWEFFDLEDLEMSAFNSKICQYSSDPEDIIEVLQAICVTTDNVLISRASAPLEFEPEKKEELEEYLEECSNGA